VQQVKDEVWWVGVKDWEIRRFHGEEYSTHRGSTYNSYLIRDEKTVLVDTVWTPFHENFVRELDEKIGLDHVDLVVINHAEQDHAGSLAYLMEKIPAVPIYCSKNGAVLIKKHFHRDFNLRVVKTGDTVDTGRNKLVFVDAPMLHWPDSMFTYVAGANVLLSNDAFGQHYASYSLFNDQVDAAELYQEALKYYANILTPFSKLVRAKIRELTGLKVPVEMIAPAHGVIWRDNPLQIVEKYDQWASDYNEGGVVILYDTMWGATRKMAWAIARGLERKGVRVKVYNTARSDHNDLVVEVFKSRGVIVGSSTINRGILSSTAAILEMIRGLQFKEKVAASFGSYGWSGESPAMIEDRLREGGFPVAAEHLGVQWDPSTGDLKACEDFGEAFAGVL
jgi:flavorubredoxin